MKTYMTQCEKGDYVKCKTSSYFFTLNKIYRIKDIDVFGYYIIEGAIQHFNPLYFDEYFVKVNRKLKLERILK